VADWRSGRLEGLPAVRVEGLPAARLEGLPAVIVEGWFEFFGEKVDVARIKI